MTNDSLQSIRDRLLKSNKWAVLALLLPRVINPLAAVVLSWMLLPYDYGVVAVPLTFTTLSQILLDTGIGQTLIQYRGEEKEGANAAFLSSLFIGLAMTAGLYIAAPAISAFFGLPEALPVLRVQIWQILISALGTVQFGLLRRHSEFRRLFRVQLLPTASLFVFAVPLAALGFGYWALVASSLLSAILQTIAFWRISEWRPAGRVPAKVIVSFTAFAALVSMEGLTAWFIGRFDRVILGHFVSTSQLGLYSFGGNLVITATSALSAPFCSDAVYSAYCSISEGSGEVLKALQKVLEMFALVLFPACFIGAALCDVLVAAFFAERWADLSWVVAIMLISPGAAANILPCSFAMKAVERPGLLATLYSCEVLLSLPLLWLTAKGGLVWFLWAKFWLHALFTPITLFVTARALKANFSSLAKPLAIPALAAAAAAGIVLCFKVLFLPTHLPAFARLPLLGAIACGSYIAILRLINRKLIERFIALATASMKK